MPKETFEFAVTAGEMLAALDDACDRHGIDSIKDLPDTLLLDIEGHLDADVVADAAIDMGYIHEDDALDGHDPELRDLRDGLRALIGGDRDMAATLLARAVDAWPDAARVVEEVVLGRTQNDRRQLSLVSLAA